MLRRVLLASVTLLAALALAAVAPPHACADTLQYAQESGALSLDQGATGITVYVAAYKYTTAAYPNSPQYSGTMSVGGSSGGLRLSIGAAVQSVAFSKTASGHKHAEVTTKPFYYTDLKTGARFLAYAVVHMTQVPLRGTVSLTVRKYGTNEIACTSGSEIGLWTGSTFIYF